MFWFSIGRDRAGSTLLKAKNLGTLTSELNISRDFVGKSDLSNLYRVSVGNRSSFNMQPSDLRKGAKVNLEMFTLKGVKSTVLKAIGRSDFGEVKGKDLNKNISFVNGYGVAIVGDNLYLSGSTEGDLNRANQGDRDSFAALYTTGGTLQWQQQFGSPGSDTAADIAADSSGNYYVGGVAVGSKFGLPDPNGYVSKYRSNGTLDWSKQITLGGVEAIAGLATDSSGNVYASGLVKGILVVSQLLIGG